MMELSHLMSGSIIVIINTLEQVFSLLTIVPPAILPKLPWKSSGCFNHPVKLTSINLAVIVNICRNIGPERQIIELYIAIIHIRADGSFHEHTELLLGSQVHSRCIKVCLSCRSESSNI